MNLLGSWKQKTVTLAALLALSIPSLSVAGKFDLKKNIKVPMSDGANLSANLYLPAEGKKFATVLMRTPYDKNGMGWMAEPLAEAGYAVVTQDVRGQGGSDGMFIPFVFEKKDGVDTLDWVARQPWCDGNIGMWGPSYLGYCALIVTPEGHPNLKTIINVAGWGDTSSMTAPGGAMHLMVALPWTLSGQISGTKGRGLNWDEAFRRTPVIEIPSSYGIDSAQWKGAVQLYNSPDAEGGMSISSRYEDIKIPTFHLAGWYDFVGPTTLDAYEGIDRTSRLGDGAMQKLLVGPWIHGQIYNVGTNVGEVSFPPTINIGVPKLAEMSIRWFDQWLRNKETGLTKEKPVKVFVMGENKWRTFDRWPPDEAQFEEWFFGSGKGAASSDGDGILSTDSPQRIGVDRFTYDPMNPVPTTGGSNFHSFPDNIGIMDQRDVEKRSDVLVYTSKPMENDMTIIGPIQAVVFASTKGRHADITAKLTEVRPDGYSANIVDAIKRGPDLLGDDTTRKMEPNEVYRFTVDMDATAITIKKGNRLRVQISSSNFPKFTRNPNTGESPETATTFRKAKQVIHHSPKHPSHILLPVMK